MSSIETQLGTALQHLKRELTPAQIDRVLEVIRLCIAADGRRHQPQTPPPPPESPDV